MISNDLYQDLKPLLFSIAYRMLGSVVEAEDIVHDSFEKINQVNLEDVKNIKSYLCKIVTNTSLDYLKSAQKRRESYVGPWLPEPLVLIEENHPYHSVIEQEDLSLAYLKIMELLRPNERAVLILKEGIGLSYAEIGSILGLSETNCRKIFSRAKNRLEDVKYRSEFSIRENNKIVLHFIEAFQLGHIDKILKMIADDVVLYSDGGGKVIAALKPIVTSKNVLSFLLGVYKKAPENYSFEMKSINGQLGIVNKFGDQIQSVISFYVENHVIKEIYLVMNPDKLVSSDI